MSNPETKSSAAAAAAAPVTCLLCQKPLTDQEVRQGIRMHTACGLKTTEYMWGDHANPDPYRSYRAQMAQGKSQENSSICLIM